MSFASPIEYTDAAQMLADYAARRARFFKPAAEPVAVSTVVPDRIRPKVLVFPINRIVTVEEIVARYRWAHPKCRLFAANRVKEGRDGFTDGATILRIVTGNTGVSRIELSSARKSGPVVRVRQITCWLMRRHTPLSLPQIGAKLGGRDHTTVLHAVRKIDDLRARDPAVRKLTDDLSATIRAEFGQ